MKGQSPGGLGVFDGLLHHGQAFGNATRDGKRVAERTLHAWGQGTQGHLTGKGQRMLENLQGFARFPLDDVKRGESPRCGYHAPRVVDVPGHLHTFPPARDTFIERALLGKCPRKIGSGHARRIAGHPEALVNEVTLEKRDVLFQVRLGARVVTRAEAGQAQIVVDRDREREFIQRIRQRACLQTELTRLCRLAVHPPIVAHVDGHPGSPQRIIELVTQSRCFLEIRKYSIGFTERKQ